MGRWQDKIQKHPHTLLTKGDKRAFVSYVSKPPSPFQEIIADSIKDLPVSLEEILTSPLFDKHDITQIEAGAITVEMIKLYVGSWLANKRIFPATIRADYELLLSNRSLHEGGTAS